jgi:hypothetical protein
MSGRGRRTDERVWPPGTRRPIVRSVVAPHGDNDPNRFACFFPRKRAHVQYTVAHSQCRVLANTEIDAANAEARGARLCSNATAYPAVLQWGRGEP